MIYIKLDEDMNLMVTVNKPIYRGDNLNRKIIYLVPLTVGEVDMLTATVYLNYIRADGEPDVVMLDRLDDKYKEAYYQYTFPINCKLTKYAGEVCTWMQVYDGEAENPTVSKSSECVLRVRESKDMDDYIGDRQVTALYQMHKNMQDGFASVETSLAAKADNIVFDPETSTIQLTANGEPIGDPIVIAVMGDVTVKDMGISDTGELIAIMTDGSIKNLGKVIGGDGAVYVPHLDERKVLTWTIETEPSDIPDPVDLNPHDEWSSVDGSTVETQYIWERME